MEEVGYEQLFDRVCSDIRERLLREGAWGQPGSMGIGFQLAAPGNSKGWQTYFGVQAGNLGPSIYSVSALPQARHLGG